MNHAPPCGIVFDLDGTLVDSGLDFDLIRREMGLPARAPILESLAALPAAEARRCETILAGHEAAGAARATPMPGALELLDLLAARGVRRAVVTRNARHLAAAVLARLGIDVDPLLAREDGPIKPDPAAVARVCRTWGVPAAGVVVVGDFLFDIEAGHQAGARTVLFTAGRDPAGLPGAELADFHLRSFDETDALLAWLGLADGDSG